MFACEFHHRVVTEAGHVGDRIVAQVNQFGKERDHLARAEFGVVKRHAELVCERAGMSRSVPLQRVGKFREVGLLALYLASPASDYMTGQVLPLDGGLTV